MSITNNKSLIFIPDISGFTRFITGTEIEHSRHIIAELLEILIDSNEVGLTVAEIEGDAILFYQENSELSISQVLGQVKTMFLGFHEHLKLYNSRRVCDCGACTTANGLTIKFVVHFAEFGIIEVKHFKKPYGFEVVRAHRLLKNKLNESEYVLITADSLSDPGRTIDNSGNEKWFQPKQSSINFDILGETPFHFSLLTDLHNEVSDPPPLQRFERSDNPITGEIFIEKPLEDVFDAISNYDLRQEWQSGVKAMLFDTNKVNRIGTKHTCVIGNNRLEIETIHPGEKLGKRTFAEKTLNVPLKMVKDMVSYFELTPKEKGTEVKVEIHYKPQPFPRSLLTGIFRNNFEKNLPLFLNDLKVFCEKQ